MSPFQEREQHLIVGLMSGTSADGVDAVLVRIRGTGRDTSVSLLHHSFLPYPEEIRSALLENPSELPAACVARLNFDIGEIFSKAALECLRQARVDPADVDLIASHGQTIVHIPPGNGPGTTLQIGEISVIAARTGIPTVGDFRPADMAVGGQGAPLVPFADYVLFRHEEKGRVILNIGGIANLTYLPPSAGLEDVLAFDTGPGNMLLDGLMYLASDGRTHTDENATVATTGKVRGDVLDELIRDPYFSKDPPKPTGREKFGRSYCRWLLDNWRDVPFEDLMRTAAELTVWSIADGIRRWVFPRGPVDELIVGGGGARNPLLTTRLVEELPETKILTHADLGIDDKAKEALAFAILANETAAGNPGNIPSATGARRQARLGKVCFPPQGGPFPEGTGEMSVW